MIGRGSLTALLLTVARAVTALQAADAKDLPRNAAPAAARTGCESFGPEFRKVAGSETCIRVSGSVRLETTIQTSGGGSFVTGPMRR